MKSHAQASSTRSCKRASGIPTCFEETFASNRESAQARVAFGSVQESAFNAGEAGGEEKKQRISQPSGKKGRADKGTTGTQASCAKSRNDAATTCRVAPSSFGNHRITDYTT